MPITDFLRQVLGNNGHEWAQETSDNKQTAQEPIVKDDKDVITELRKRRLRNVSSDENT